MSPLLHHQFRGHILMVRTADDPARHFVFAFGLRGEADCRGMTGLHRLFDSQVRHVKSMLYVRRTHIQRNRLARLQLNDSRLNRVLLHDDGYVLPGGLVLLASRRKK